jgi:hypothetical protein
VRKEAAERGQSKKRFQGGRWRPFLFLEESVLEWAAEKVQRDKTVEGE